jgi:hypothetical protein
MNAIKKLRPSANLRFHKVAPEPKQLPTPGLLYELLMMEDRLECWWNDNWEV